MNDLGPMRIRPSDKVYSHEEMSEAFPDVDPGFVPLGTKIIVQLRTPKQKSKGGIILSDFDKDTELWNTQIGKVRDIGPVAFCNRETLKSWPEGAWVRIGDFVRVPKYNQDRWMIDHEGPNDATGKKTIVPVLFMLVSDIDILGKKTGNPLDVKAYI
jgi:co-chaperonin GroES (HSP10)